MRRILVTQRIDDVVDYGERRDAIDQRWTDYLLQIDLFPVFVSNNIRFVKCLLDYEEFSGVLFTGGNTLQKYGGNAQERDAVEETLLGWALQHEKPIVGICRGMQIIQDYFGVSLGKIENHIGTCHRLQVYQGLVSEELLQLDSVTVYHEYGARNSVPDLNIVAKSEDGIVMAIEHEKYPVYGHMWHGERNQPFNPIDQRIISKYYGL
ncbi:MAG: gamma-glutamyl-gamma-aminobutyrate hydrolase family protein [Gammaproteobacteria bacterium]|nr:gamma-glutamyl-gamma-aminobutyrate hydrolase family protein [Gammaproteobacteria bacterium]